MAASIYFNRLASQKCENTILQTTLRGVLISWTEFRKKNHEKYLQYKGNSAKTHDKDESILSPICISETDKNDNVRSDNSEDCPWPKGTICIAGDSVISGLQPGLLSQKRRVKVKSFSSANVRDMRNNIKPILWHKPEYIILHVGTNNALSLPPNKP